LSSLRERAWFFWVGENLRADFSLLL
jgi:hypothetical protein